MALEVSLRPFLCFEMIGFILLPERILLLPLQRETKSLYAYETVVPFLLDGRFFAPVILLNRESTKHPGR